MKLPMNELPEQQKARMKNGRDWSKVFGICGFGDGRYQKMKCGVDVWVTVFIQNSGWAAVFKKCEPVCVQCPCVGGRPESQSLCVV